MEQRTGSFYLFNTGNPSRAIPKPFVHTFIKLLSYTAVVLCGHQPVVPRYKGVFYYLTTKNKVKRQGLIVTITVFHESVL